MTTTLKKTFLEWLQCVTGSKPMMTQQEWIVSDNTGISSKTMWAAINDVKNAYRADKPYDPADFNRCLKYVENTGVTKNQLQKVKKAYAWWAPYIDNWDNLVAIFKEEASKGNSCPKTYDYLQELREQSDKIRHAPR